MALNTSLEKITPFLFSIFLHLALAGGLYSSTSAQDPTIQIEVQIQKVQTNALSDSKPAETQSSSITDKIESLTTPTAQTENNSATISGSEVGIHATYPRLSRILRENGRVIIGIENDKVVVSESSGFPRLDQSALTATKNAIETGVISRLFAERSSLKINFIFRLDK